MKTLVFGLVGVANVLAAFAEGGTAIDVAAGQTNVITTSTVVDGDAQIHGTLIIDGTGSKVRVTPTLDTSKSVVVRLGSGAGDNARLEIKGDAKMLAGEIKNDPRVKYDHPKGWIWQCDAHGWMPTVFAGAFRARDGRTAYVFANATEERQPFSYRKDGAWVADALSPNGLKLVPVK